MESDVLRSLGENTMVSMWVEGGVRDITITRSAIEAYLAASPDSANSDTQIDREHFVRNHLSLVTRAAKAQLAANRHSLRVTIDRGDLYPGV